MESQNLLFNDQVVKIRSDAAAGDLGEVREVDVMLALDLVDSRFGDMNLTGRGVALPGGAVHDFLPHLAYLFLHFTEQPVESVIGRLRNASGNGRVGFDQMDALVFAGDVRGRMRVACDLEPSSLRLTVRGTKGSRETDLYNPYMRCEGGANIGKRVVIERIDSSVRFARSAFTNLRDKVLDHGTLHGLPVMLDAFYAALQDGRPPPIPESAIRSTALLVDRLVALHEQA
jgi:predicted dehydrogenase